MSRSKRTQSVRATRRFTRSRFDSLLGRGRAAALTNNAGLAVDDRLSIADRANVESLERRQMLFSLAVTANDVDPATGLGTVRANFAYILPYLNTNYQLPTDTTPTEVSENFSEVPFGAVGSGTFLAESGIRFRHNIAPGDNFRVFGIPPAADNQERWLRVDFNNATEFFEMSFYGEDNAPPRPPIGVQSVAFDLRRATELTDPRGLDTDNVRLQLVFNGRILQTITGDALRALIQPQGPLNSERGIGRMIINAPPGVGAFDTVRFEVISAGGTTNPAFELDNITYLVPEPSFADLIDSLDFGATAVLTGPVGATVSFFDLNGNAMVRTISLGIPTGGSLAIVDLDDDGTPNFNVGIGSIVISGGDSRTSFTLWGGTVEASDEAPDDADEFDGIFAYTLADANPAGIYDAFQEAGFGYAWEVVDGTLNIAGLPPGPGSVVVGSPFIRANPLGAAGPNTITTGFTQTNQGIFVRDGQSIGTINIHGVLHGASIFTGFVDNIYVGYLPGSISVEGDLGALFVGSDAGLAYPDEGLIGSPEMVKTNGQLFVGRTVGQIAIGGRTLMDVTVLGDLNSPTTRPARDVFTYYEREFVFGINPDADPASVINSLLDNQIGSTPNSEVFRASGTAPVFGNSFYRNDGLLNAEFISSSATGVRIKGDLSALDPLNAEDKADAYAFVADGTQDIIIDGFKTDGGLYFRIVDQFGRTLAAPNRPADARGDAGLTTTQLRWRPDGPGLYYLVVSDPNGNDADTDFGAEAYTIVMTGMAPVTLGSITTGAGAGFEQRGYSVSVLNGDIGALRIGVGVTGPDGASGLGLDAINPVGTDNTAEDAISFRGGTITTPGSLYNISTGDDIGVPGGRGQQFVNIFVGRDLGTVYTGLFFSTVAGTDVTEGDVNNLNLTVGGRVAGIFISGGVGMDQDGTDPFAITGQNRFVLRTGDSGGVGDIGIIRLGGHIGTDTFRITTSPGSTVGALLVSQDDYRIIQGGAPGADFGIYARGIGGQGLPIFTGAGSDIRFVDIPRQDLFNSNNVFLPLIGGETQEIVDDAGSIVRISIENALPGQPVGFVRTLGVDGSQGVAISQIQADLTGGAVLRIQGSNPLGRGVVGIGRIIITGGDAGSRIVIDGSVEVDVFFVDASAAAIDEYVNTTIGGDLVMGSFAGLSRLEVKGNIGSTQWPTWANSNYAEAIAYNLDGRQFGPGIPDVESGEANGDVFRPIADDNFDNGNAYLDDIGAPYDIFLNGIFIAGPGPIGGDGRFDVLEIKATGSIGDVLSNASIANIIADSDGIAPLGSFHGLLGTIFTTTDLGNVDIGMGFAPATSSPLAEVGIFAADDIARVFSTREAGVIIRGPIIARNINPADNFDLGDIDGLTTVEVRNGQVIDSYIASERLDAFWRSASFADITDQFGTIQRIDLSNTNLFRSTIAALRVEEIRIEGGFYDASRVFSTGFVGTVRATGFRNSTVGADELQERESVITSGGDLRSVESSGDINDLRIDVVGSILDGVNAVNGTRIQFEVDNTIRSATFRGDLRGSTFSVGRLPILRVTGNIVSSTINSSGQVDTISAANILNSSINVTGPDGQLSAVTVTGNITGSISSSGPIGTISAGGDIRGSISTTTAVGGVNSITAGGDLNITADFAAGVNRLVAGRNIGNQTNPGVILIRGNLAQATATNGQLYSDIRVGGNVTGAVTIGAVANKIGQALAGSGSVIAFGRIASVVVTGDFGGDVISYTGGIGAVTITNGSFLSGRTISAFDGSVDNITITNGNLYGSVHADYNLTSLRVVAGADGVFGDIGVNPNFSQGVVYNALRNQLPPNTFARTGVQGPSIYAGLNIVNVTVTNGSVFETTFGAGRVIQNITITGSVANDALTTSNANVFYAGDLIDRVTITGNADRVSFISGLTGFGADGVLGGEDANADAIKSGSINVVTIGGALSNATFSAGVNAGNGIYNDGIGETVATGLSSVNTIAVAGSVTNASVYADSLAASVANDNRFNRVTSIVNADNLINLAANPTGISFTGARTFGTLSFTITGPGNASYDQATNRLFILNTTSATTLSIAATSGAINNFTLISNDDASLGTLNVQSTVTGASSFVIDGNVTTVNFATLTTTGRVTIGGDVTTANFAPFQTGTFSARSVGTLRVTGDYGTPATNEASINVLNLGDVNVTGVARALINSDRDIGRITFSGGADRALIRSGGTINSLVSTGFRQTVLSARDNLGAVTINGDMFDAAILVGADLGSDGFFGGTGTAADTLTTGFLGQVTITGNFRESDIAAGFLRGPDGFFGTADDTIAPGRSSIAGVSIAGGQVGSTRFGESYRIASSGSLGPVRLAGQTFSGAFGNFATATPNLAPASIQVTNFAASVQGNIYVATLTFNQPIDASSISNALSVLEVRGTQGVEIRLIEGIDFTTTYLPNSNQLQIALSTAVTQRNLPQVSGIPGPGVYRIVLNQDSFRGALGGVKIDGDGNGFAESADSFAGNIALGDAGDKLVAVTLDADPGPGNRRVDMYGPTNLDVVFDNTRAPDGLADTNKTFTIAGVIGDHPDNDNAFFRASGDTDLYSITLQAGQILRLGRLTGAAAQANLGLFAANGTLIGPFADNAFAVALPAPIGDGTQLTFESAFLIKQTGTYIIAVFNGAPAFLNNANVPNLDPVPGGTGPYSFTVNVFDDGDSGFSSNSSAGDGQAIAEAPASIAFAGLDGLFGTADDLPQIFLAGFTFTLNTGPDGQPNTADDIVSGSNGLGATSVRQNGVVTTTVEASIGPAGHTGVPGDIAADVDIFHLNNRQTIAAGSRYRVTLRLTDSGADLGATASFGGQRGSVQFALFDTSASTGVGDATLVFSPTAFTGVGGQTPRILADGGHTKYGYDAKGDFFIEFTLPDRIDAPGQDATFALYVQGIFNTDYALEIVNLPSGTITPSTQNVLIETGGGLLDWLLPGGLTSEVAAFTARSLGFTGTFNGISADQYILTQVVANLNAVFQGAGLDVRFSTSSVDFEFQPFSTVFVTNSPDPLTPLFDILRGFTGGDANNAFTSSNPYGYSEGSDPFNANQEDQAVIFVQPFALQGYTPGQADADRFAQGLTGAVARRVGELLGLRISAENTGLFFDPLAADAVDNNPGTGRAYTLPNFNRSLSNNVDAVPRTNFFLGNQNAGSLLDRIISGV